MAEHRTPGVSIALIDDGEVVQAAGIRHPGGRRIGARHRGNSFPGRVGQQAGDRRRCAPPGAHRSVAVGRRRQRLPDVLAYPRRPGDHAAHAARSSTADSLRSGSTSTRRESRSRRWSICWPGARRSAPHRSRLSTPRVPSSEPTTSTMRWSNRSWRTSPALPFPELMRETVFGPLGMVGSTFDQGYPSRRSRSVARGHDEGGAPIPGGWQTRPGCRRRRFVVDSNRSRPPRRRDSQGLPRSSGSTLLDQQLARQMLTSRPGNLYGLGSMVDEAAGDLEFGHSGETTGYRAMVFNRMRDGAGVVVLTNSDSGHEVVRFLATALGKVTP